MNEPDRELTVQREKDEDAVILAKDAKIPNTMVFTLVKEDHTMGNLIRMALLNIRQVRFAGYRIPHPLEHVVIMKVETSPEATPLEAMKTTLSALMEELDIMENVFKQACDKFKRNRQHAEYQ